MKCHWNLAAGWNMFVLTSFVATSVSAQMIITGVVDGPLPGGLPKGLELYVAQDIPDLSRYALGSANNGKGTGGEEFLFPGDSATAGDFLYIATEEVEFENFFGFPPNYTDQVMSINGDDAFELFFESQVIDIFGQIDVDGTGEPWEYIDGWAYREDKTGPDQSTFVLDNWQFSGPDALDGELTNATALMVAPIGSYLGSDHRVALEAGDADQDFDFDQFDLVKVQIGGKYLSGQPATWGDGDWNGAPGGQQGSPPPGNERFDQLDIVAALNTGIYLQGPYGAMAPAGHPDSGRTSVGDDANTVPVPEPTGMALLGVGLAFFSALTWVGRKQLN